MIRQQEILKEIIAQVRKGLSLIGEIPFSWENECRRVIFPSKKNAFDLILFEKQRKGVMMLDVIEPLLSMEN